MVKLTIGNNDKYFEVLNDNLILGILLCKYKNSIIVELTLKDIDRTI